MYQDVMETELAEGWGGLGVYAEGVPCGVTDRDVLERSGYQVDLTPIDTLMRDDGCALSVAHAMEYGDDPYEC